MPASIVVATEHENAKVFLSQQPLEQVLYDCRKWSYSHVHRIAVHELRLDTSHPEQMPPNMANLAHVATVWPLNVVEYYTSLLSQEIEKLRPEQCIVELQRQVDYLQRKIDSAVRQLTPEPTKPAVTNATGT